MQRCWWKLINITLYVSIMVASGRHRFSALLVIQELNLSYGYIHVPYTGPWVAIPSGI